MGFDPVSYILAKKGLRFPTLKGLVIDTDKDWRGYRITNLGEPADPNDAARKIYVDVATTGLGINYYLLDAADSEVSAYKQMSITPPELSEAYVETSQNGAGDYEIGAWIAPAGSIPVLRLGVYTLHFQAERVSGNIDVRFFFRLYERDSEGNETLIAESSLSDLVTDRRNVVVSLILPHDYELSEGSRLVVKVYARYLSGGSSTTMRLYYQGDVRSRLATPIAKEILDTIYAAKQHTHALEDLSDVDSSMSPSDGQVLMYDSNSGQWTAGTVKAGGTFAPYAGDETELSTTSTSYTSMKTFNMFYAPSVGINPTRLVFVAEAYNNTSGKTTYVGLFIDGNQVAELQFSETSYTVKWTDVDLTALNLAEGKHSIDIKVKVTGGTGYIRMTEVWLFG